MKEEMSLSLSVCSVISDETTSHSTKAEKHQPSRWL